MEGQALVNILAFYLNAKQVLKCSFWPLCEKQSIEVLGIEIRAVAEMIAIVLWEAENMVTDSSSVEM